MVKSSSIFVIVSLITSSCSNPDDYRNACEVIADPSILLGQQIKLEGVVVYDEFPMLFSTKKCAPFDFKKKYISLSMNFSDAVLTKHIYKSREMSNKERYASGLIVEGTVKEFNENGNRYFYIDVQQYKIRPIVRF